MSIIGTTRERIAEARKRRRDMREIGDMPAYLLADIGYARDWWGNVHKLPNGDRR